MYEDVNKDGKLTQDDLVFLGTDDPKLSFSFNFGFEWRGFDFNAVFQGVGDRTIYREIDAWKVPFKAIWLNTSNQSVGNVWSLKLPITIIRATQTIMILTTTITWLLHGL